MLHLLSHEEANVTIEQQKDTHRHLSPAHFPYNGEETEFFFFFFFGGAGGDLFSFLIEGMHSITILLQIFVFGIFLVSM